MIETVLCTMLSTHRAINQIAFRKNQNAGKIRTPEKSERRKNQSAGKTRVPEFHQFTKIFTPFS